MYLWRSSRGERVNELEEFERDLRGIDLFEQGTVHGYLGKEDDDGPSVKEKKWKEREGRQKRP